MKKIQLIKSFSAFVTAMMVSLYSFAQDKKVDIDISTNKSDSTWYTQPWVWIVGGAVFILLLVALMRGNRSRD